VQASIPFISYLVTVVIHGTYLVGAFCLCVIFIAAASNQENPRWIIGVCLILLILTVRYALGAVSRSMERFFRVFIVVVMLFTLLLGT
jgi:hypothetical protein